MEPVRYGTRFRERSLQVFALAVEATHLRRKKLGWNMADGVLLTLLFTIPIVNFAGPIIASAYMTHRFHRTWSPGTIGELARE